MITLKEKNDCGIPMSIMVFITTTYSLKKLKFQQDINLLQPKRIPRAQDLKNVDTIVSGNTTFFVNETLNFLEDPSFALHILNADLKIYRLGSLSPVGKYIGFGFRYGFGKIKTTDDIYVGKRDVPYKDNFFFSRAELLDLDTTHVSSDLKTSFFQITANIGRNYPLTKNLILNVGMTFPVISWIKSAGAGNFGFGIDTDGYQFNEGDTFRRLTDLTMKMYSRVSANIGLRYAF